MKKIEEFDQVEEAKNLPTIEPGAYICQITAVEDDEEKQYLKVYFDIVEKGKFKGHFKKIKEQFGDDRGVMYKSYKRKALPFFKAFITAVEKSNDGYEWNWNEDSLVNKNIVVVFGEEEYLPKDAEHINDTRTIVRPQSVRSIQAYKNGDIKIPRPQKMTDEEKKEMWIYHGNSPEDTETPSSSLDEIDIEDDDVPF